MRSVALTACLLLTACAHSTVPAGAEEHHPLKTNPIVAKVPVFGGHDVHDFAADRGHVVLVDIWASWCQPCIASLPEYDRLWKEYQGRGLLAYALSVDADPAQVTAFVQQTHLTIPVLMNEDSKVAEEVFDVSELPTTFILDKRGVIRHVHRGVSDESIAKLRSEIEPLLAEQVSP